MVFKVTQAVVALKVHKERLENLGKMGIKEKKGHQEIKELMDYLDLKAL